MEPLLLHLTPLKTSALTAGCHIAHNDRLFVYLNIHRHRHTHTLHDTITYETKSFTLYRHSVSCGRSMQQRWRFLWIHSRQKVTFCDPWSTRLTSYD